MNIMFNDLKEDTQKELLKEFNISSPNEMNWDIIPIFTIENETPCENADDSTSAEPVDGTFISEWDDGTVVTDCKVDLKNKHITEIKTVATSDMGNLIREYVLIEDVYYNAYPSDDVDPNDPNALTYD